MAQLQYHKITAADFGKSHLRINGRTYAVANFLGRIMRQDVGKRIYVNNGIPQVENEKQFQDRLNAKTKDA